MSKRIIFNLLIGIVIFNMACGSPEVQETRLQNRIQIITKQVPQSRVVTVLLAVRAGTINETEETKHISHLIEHCLFRASENYKDIRWEIDSYGGQYQSDTSKDFTSFSVTVTEPFLTDVLKIFIDVIKNAQFEDSMVHFRKTELIQQLKSEMSNYRRQILNVLIRNLFILHPYRHEVQNSLKTVKRFTSEDLNTYYQNLYIPENMILVIVGGFQDRPVKNLLRESLASFTRIPQKSYSWKQEPEQTSPKEVRTTHTLDSKLATVSVAWHAPSITNPDTYSMDVLLVSLGIGESSRLKLHILNSMSSVYGVWNEYITPREPGYYVIHAVCEPSVVDEVKAKILREVEILRKDSITPKELKRAIIQTIAPADYNRESTLETANYLGFWSIMEDFHFAQNYLANISKVNLSDVQQVARKYLKENNYTSVILLPSDYR